MIKYIILDVDRTLVDSFEPELLSFQEAYTNVTGKKLSNDQINNFTTMPTSIFLENLDLSKEQIIKIMNEWEITFPKYKTQCFSGIKEVIKELNEKGYLLGVITSRTIDEYHELDDELKDVNNLFKIIVTSDKVNQAKPNPESMNYVYDKLNCTSNEVIYIGDSYIDKEFAINSKCLFIPACYDNKELINEKNVCLNPKDIPNIIEKIKNTNN